MPFDSLQFWLIFLPLVFALTYLPHRSVRWQNVVLLIASLIFYAAWTGYFVFLLILVTLMNYFLGRLLENATADRANILSALAVVCNLLILGLFKYTSLLTSIAPGGSVLAPIGISFYIFQNLAYVLEVRRKQLPPIHSLMDYAVFSCYFPLVLSGPIERVRHLVPQLRELRKPGAIPLERAAGLIILGLFQKVVLAKIASDWSVPVFTHPGNYSAIQVVAGIYLYAAEIYVDFAGYTNLVRGISYLLGIELVENFRQPYLSSNITEFWQRWHTSLSNWFRDFLFYPLSRFLLRRTHNRYTGSVRATGLFVTMLLIGVWHGATWNYVIWGSLHGFYLALHRGAQSVGWSIRRILNLLVTFHAVLLSWIFFGTAQPSDALLLIGQIFRSDSVSHVGSVLPIVLFVYGCMFAIDIGQRVALKTAMPTWSKALVWGLGLFLIYVLWQAEYQPFVYFKF